MKDVNEVLAQKIREYQRVHREVAALRIAATILAETGDLLPVSVPAIPTEGEIVDYPKNL